MPDKWFSNTSSLASAGVPDSKSVCLCRDFYWALGNNTSFSGIGLEGTGIAWVDLSTP